MPLKVGFLERIEVCNLKKVSIDYENRQNFEDSSSKIVGLFKAPSFSRELLLN